MTFLDTGFLLAAVRKDDQHHQAAVSGAELYPGPYITTELVLSELASALAKPPHRSMTVAVINRILNDTATEVIPWNAFSFQEAFTLFCQRMDKSWGLVDCFSFLAMQQRKVKLALTFDIHFKQAGFYTPLIEK